jgi:hypothetical protein
LIVLSSLVAMILPFHPRRIVHRVPLNPNTKPHLLVGATHGSVFRLALTRPGPEGIAMCPPGSFGVHCFMLILRGNY